jgi:hypothetical protein
MTVIVDCGSGYSRVTSFHRLVVDVVDDEQTTSCQPLVRAITTKSNISALHTVIHCPVKSLEWLQQLVEIVEHVLPDDDDVCSSGATTTSTTQKVLIGATGGVRDLISSGDITATELDIFRNLLTMTNLPFEASLRILSGEEEATYEFLSAEYCAKQCGYYAGNSHDTEDSSSNLLGLLSSGGMSSQLFVNGGAHCLETQIKTGNKWGLEHGMEQGMVLYSNHVEKAIADIPEAFGGTGVFFVAIEMLAAVGEKAGIGGIVMSVTEAMDALATFIQKEVEHDQELGDDYERTWRTYVHVMSGIVGKSILAKLHPESTIMFLREFKIRDGHILKPSWPLGCAIETPC